MEKYSGDLRFGLRQLRLNPMFTAVAVLSLALGIGANVAIFRLIDAIRLRQLPVSHPEQLAYLDFAKNSRRSGWWSTRSANFTSKLWDSIQQHQQAFSGMIAWSAQSFNLAQQGKARYAEGLFVNGDFFRVLDVPAVVGRVFTAEDDQPGCGSPRRRADDRGPGVNFGRGPGRGCYARVDSLTMEASHRDSAWAWPSGYGRRLAPPLGTPFSSRIGP